MFFGITSTTFAGTNQPNIIFILVDDMGWSDIGCFGSEIHTPNLDRLADTGIRFSQMHNTSKCFPSRACLLTGVYAQQCGMSKKFEKFTNAVTLGEVLRTAGYRTYASGKHHSRESLYDRGFDRYYGLLDGANNQFNPGKKRDGEPVPAQKNKSRVYNFDDRQESPYTPEEHDFYTTDYYTKWAIDFLEKDQDSEQPFFLYLAYTAPHDNLQAWPRDSANYETMYNAGYGPIREARIQKMIFYEGSVHVPLLMRFPGRIKAGTVVDQPVSSMDVCPTILDYMNMPPQKGDGISLRKMIEGQRVEHDVVSYTPGTRTPNYMIRSGDLKLMMGEKKNNRSVDAVYDLKKDPHEMQNLIVSPKAPEKNREQVKQMKQKLVQWLEKHEPHKAEALEQREI